MLQDLGAIKVGFLQETDEYFFIMHVYLCTVHKMQLDLFFLKIKKSEKSSCILCTTMQDYCIFPAIIQREMFNKNQVQDKEPWEVQIHENVMFSLCSFVLELEMNKEQKICVAFEAVTKYLYILIFR